MTHEEKILNLFDEYFENASTEEIQADVKIVNSLGFNGISLENYLEDLNHSTAFQVNTNERKAVLVQIRT